jgi:hypothetical protein
VDSYNPESLGGYNNRSRQPSHTPLKIYCSSCLSNFLNIYFTIRAILIAKLRHHFTLNPIDRNRHRGINLWLCHILWRMIIYCYRHSIRSNGLTISKRNSECECPNAICCYRSESKCFSSHIVCYK